MNQPEHILIVDDEESIRFSLARYLKNAGYVPHLASCPREAQEKIASQNYAIAIVDRILANGENGLDFLGLLQKQQPFCQKVLISGFPSFESASRAIALQVFAYLAKPVRKEQILATVAQAAEENRMKRRTALVEYEAFGEDSGCGKGPPHIATRQIVHDFNQIINSMKNYQQVLEDAVSKRTQELRIALSRLEMASMDTVIRLAAAAEYKDEETGGHIKRISHYSTAIAREIGLKEKTCQLLLFAASMHDIGKIGIPDRILLKPGKLNNQEWAVMRQHTTIGGQILQGADNSLLRLSQIIALTHHEKWDGSGYPQGLSGNKIPLVGQIVAIADVFDALTSRRPYKEPFSLEKSLEIIRARNGSHFAPQVGNAFFAALDDILAIKQKYQDNLNSFLATG